MGQRNKTMQEDVIFSSTDLYLIFQFIQKDTITDGEKYY